MVHAHNSEMINDYKNSSASHVKKTNRIQARKGRVKNHHDVLIFLGLLGEKKDRVKQFKG